jgi:hypothetical protein
LSSSTNGGSKAAIPPIPEPPSPPSVKDLVGFPVDLCKDEHPLYPPRHDNFVAHIDPKAFHITDGRYFGLATNNVADPNFVGPNAPGLGGVSSGSGLSTSSSGGGISGAMALILATTYNGVTAGAASALTSSSDARNTNSVSPLHEKIRKEADESPFKAAVGGPKPTATLADLKKIMDQDDEPASRMKLCIIRAAVHASRSGRHWQPFIGPNREIYPDVSKAFASHAGVKPCQRCKSNKQGVSPTRSTSYVSRNDRFEYVSLRVNSFYYRLIIVDFGVGIGSSTMMAVTAFQRLILSFQLPWTRLWSGCDRTISLHRTNVVAVVDRQSGVITVVLHKTLTKKPGVEG